MIEEDLGLEDFKVSDDVDISSNDSGGDDIGFELWSPGGVDKKPSEASGSIGGPLRAHPIPNLYHAMDEVSISSEFEQTLAIGRCVHCFDEVYSLYCEFGRFKGFSVRRGRQRFSGNSESIKWKEYICSCAGKPDTNSEKVRLSKFKKRVL